MKLKKGDICPNCGTKIIYNQQIVCKYCGINLEVKTAVDKIAVKEVEARTEKHAPFSTPQIPNFDADRKKIESKRKAKSPGQISFDNGQIQESEVKILQEIESELKIKLIKIDKNDFNTKIGFIGENNRIKGLSLYNCEIKTVPKSLFNFLFLEKLNLSFNQLTTLPDSIIRLTSLQKLDLSYNLFTSIPKSVCYLTSLEELNLNVNHIESIPKSIMNLISLQKLDLRLNVLFSLPESMKNLQKLKSLLIKDNPLFKNMEKKTKILIKHLQQKGVSITK